MLMTEDVFTPNMSEVTFINTASMERLLASNAHPKSGNT